MKLLAGQLATSIFRATMLFSTVISNVCRWKKIILLNDSHKNLATLSQIANRELGKVANWLGANKLSLNLSKTQFIIFKAKNKKNSHNIEIQINKQIIEQVNNAKFLGLILDKELTWKQHIKLVETKISKMSGILVRARRYTSIMIFSSLE